MIEQIENNIIEREVTPIERFFTWSPYSLVTMMARIRGEVTESALRNAVDKVQLMHPILQTRMVTGDTEAPHFTSEGVGEILIDFVPRTSDDQWIAVVKDYCRIPFEFDARPALRFILVQSPAESDLVILCHHIICDGMSLAYLARDLMEYLGDPIQEAEWRTAPHPIDIENIPDEVSINAVTKFFLNRVNKKWSQGKTIFDEEDYRSLSEAYWRRYIHQVLSIELSEAETSALVERCRRENITVNSAIAAAAVGAQVSVRGAQASPPSIGVAASLRDRIQPPAGEGMGFYAGVVTLDFKYQGHQGFWENARRFHQQVQPQFNNRELFKDPLAWCYLDPTILEAINFKKLGGLVPPDSTRYAKLSDFSQRDDVVLSILKRDKMDTLDKIFMGTAVTNLGRMDFPRQYGDLELDRLIMKPGGGFPLVTVNLVLGAVTCSGKLSLLIEYVEDNIDRSAMEEIKVEMLKMLLGS